MRTIVLVSVWAVAFLNLATRIAEADPVLDQSFLSGSIVQDGGVGSGHYGSPIVIQTFTVGRSGFLSAVAIPLTRLNLPSTVTAAIYTTSQGVPTSTRLGLASKDAASLPRAYLPYPFKEADLTTFDYGSQNVAITAGDQLAIILTSTEPWSGANGSYYYYGGPGYTGGGLTLDIGNGPMSLFPYSLFFQTYVETAAIPEPASIALAGAGLFVAVSYLRLTSLKIERHTPLRAILPRAAPGSANGA